MFGARPIRIENGNRRFRVSPTGDIGVSRFCTRVLFRTAANYHGRTANGRPYGSTILEHRIIVGASIARPPAGWRKAIRIQIVRVAFALSRPVTLQKSLPHSRAVSHRCKFLQTDGQWPPLRVQ